MPKATSSSTKSSTKPSSSSSKPSSKTVRISSSSSSSSSTAPKGTTSPSNMNGKIAKKDLREKAKDLSQIEKISSKDAPLPKKGALKRTSQVDQELEPEEEDDEEEDDEDDVEEDGEGIDFLKGFEEGDEDEDVDEGGDSSDEEEQEESEKGKKFQVELLPKVDKKKLAEKEKAKAERKKNAQKGVVYLGRIPHGFHEAEMKSYFSQFGEVTRLRLSRNKKTGASKHYAFIEFAYASVANIVQETMDNYLLSGHLLVCKIVPNDQIHPKMWIGANRKFRVVPVARKEAKRRNETKTEDQQKAIKKRLLKREQQKRAKLAALGIDYDFAGYSGKVVDPTNETAEVKEVEVKDGKKKKEKKTKEAGTKKEKKVKEVQEPPKKKARKST